MPRARLAVSNVGHYLRDPTDHRNNEDLSGNCGIRLSRYEHHRADEEYLEELKDRIPSPARKAGNLNDPSQINLNGHEDETGQGRCCSRLHGEKVLPFG